MNKYEFSGMRWIPGYNDFDFDWFECDAKSEADAWKELDKWTTRWTWKSVGIVSINGLKTQ